MATEPTAGTPAETAPRQMGLGEILFSFDGRAKRSAYLVWFVVCFVVMVIAQVIAGNNGNGAPLIAALILAWPSFAIAIKRFHDRDKSGWWVLIGFIPIIGSIWLLVELGFLPGTPGPNRFGPPLSGF